MNLSVEHAPEHGDGPFRLDSASHQGVTVGQATFPPLTCINSPAQTPPERVRYFTYFTNQKHIVAAEGADPFCLQANEIVLLSTRQPWKLHFSKPYTITTLAIDGELVHDYLPDHERLLARRLPFPCNLNKVLTGLVQSAHAIAKAGYFEESAQTLARSFFGSLSLTQLGRRRLDRLESGLPLEMRRLQVKSHIDRHYSRPGLTISAIAESLHLSARYIQMAFADDATSPAEYLRQCRLKAAARLLADPRWSAHSVTDIAFSCGFNSSSYFSTQFRAAFKESPDSYRKRVGPACARGFLVHRPGLDG